MTFFEFCLNIIGSSLDHGSSKNMYILKKVFDKIQGTNPHFNLIWKNIFFIIRYKHPVSPKYLVVFLIVFLYNNYFNGSSILLICKYFATVNMSIIISVFKIFQFVNICKWQFLIDLSTCLVEIENPVVEKKNIDEIYIL